MINILQNFIEIEKSLLGIMPISQELVGSNLFEHGVNLNLCGYFSPLRADEFTPRALVTLFGRAATINK